MMEPFVFDLYPKGLRIGITVTLLICALILFPMHAGYLAAIFILAAAIAFHTEYRLVLDPKNQTYTRLTLVKPFGAPQTGSFGELDCIEVSMESSQYGTSYKAHLLFKVGKYDPPIKFILVTGSIAKVAAEVAKIAEATKIPIRETDQVRALHRGLDTLQGLKGPEAPK
ncbi:MAG TPA: hypothetical protein VHE55_00715 [Fimbriimonadaceae bacterium]|nr:hypothetical protein [Fimbriimonadaceae bacterium]